MIFPETTTSASYSSFDEASPVSTANSWGNYSMEKKLPSRWENPMHIQCCVVESTHVSNLMFTCSQVIPMFSKKTNPPFFTCAFRMHKPSYWRSPFGSSYGFNLDIVWQCIFKTNRIEFFTSIAWTLNIWSKYVYVSIHGEAWKIILKNGGTKIDKNRLLDRVWNHWYEVVSWFLAVSF